MHTAAAFAPTLKALSRDQERAASANISNWETMSDLSPTSGRATLKAQFGANPNVLMPLLWLAAAVALALPSIRSGVFDAMSTVATGSVGKAGSTCSNID
jgi:hypothetical protein